MSVAKLTMRLRHYVRAAELAIVASKELAKETNPTAVGKGGESEASPKGGGGDKDDLSFVTDGGIKNVSSTPTAVSPSLNLSLAAHVVTRAVAEAEKRIQKAGAETAKEFQREIETATSRMLDKLLDAAENFGNSAASMGKKGERSTGGFLTAEFARSLVEMFMNALVLRGRTDDPFKIAEAIRSMANLEKMFMTWFPQFGSIAELAREMLRREGIAPPDATHFRVPGRRTSSSPSKPSTTATTSSGRSTGFLP